MFKFNPQQALTDQPLGSGHESSVYPYLEGSDDSKWVVKFIKINDSERINSLLQNILTTTSASYGSVVPIKGHDIHRDHQGGATAYLKMPRMQQSLKDQIQYYRANQHIKLPLDQIVHCFYSIAGCLDELAQKEIAHRNLKPSNVLIDKAGRVYLSDIRMIEPVNQGKEVEMETKHGFDEDSIYKAPETFYDHWAKNEEDLHKADAWSMGIVIAKVCLIDSLIPISPDLPMEDNRNIIEQNMTLIAARYGQHLAGIVRRLLALNPRERETFSGVRVLLEETFPQIINKDVARDVAGKQKHKVINISGGPSKIYAGVNDESTLLDDDMLNEGAMDNGSLLGLNKPKWLKFRRPEWFNPEWFQFRRPEWLNRNDLKEELLKRKRWVVILVSVVLLLILLASLGLSEAEKQERFVDIMTGIQIRHSNYFKIDFEPRGILQIEPINSNAYNSYFDYNTEQWIYKRFNDEILINLMNDVTTLLAKADIEDHVKWFKFIFLDNSHVTDKGIAQLQYSLLRMNKLQGFAFELINGPQITNFALQQLYTTLSDELKYLKNVGIGLLNGERNMLYTDIRDLVIPILNNRKLVSFYFTLLYPYLSDSELQDLAKTISDKGQNLETLRINLRSYSFSSTAFKQFNSIILSNLKGLKEIVLDYTASPMTDEVLDAIATGVTSQKKLIRFELILNSYYNALTDAGLKYFGYQLSRTKLKDLKYLSIDVPYGIYSDARNWVRNQLQYIPEVHIRPEY